MRVSDGEVGAGGETKRNTLKPLRKDCAHDRRQDQALFNHFLKETT